ncbi:glycosyl transferase group 1 [Desulfofarcimen acetoxidans DSM 771]|uniref:Glycosyl transferase group 1 n=1 Tax=Desulfofarcimen acetoxidans (strain ATCC 49208 / DSM 771 / KCTC 5769 / VKM B-1644 / 5575) TaxID=485916 RepID=C8W232_DESAS|nr:glycosyltransferase family 4 protein [Desulfofarcimen acetoxidans]ACV61696.1 glycosyl transferase group 1 [Desulfofarcimen acetoxidans DSM 771]
MRVLMLSWEYPPKSVGGLAQHVYDLTSALIKEETEVFLLTCGSPGAPEYEQINGVHVYRINPYQVSSPDFITWVMQLNVAMLERAIPLINDLRDIQIVHAHDWLVAYAARALKHAHQVPMVVTIHATEYGRNNGLHNDLQRHISDIEWWLCYEAWRVICCSFYMKNELSYVFQIPQDKLKVIPNGVNPENFVLKESRLSRDDYAAPDEKIIFYVGRLVREKGVQVLLEAMPDILSRQEKTKLIIAGKGPHEAQLREQAVRMGIAHRVYFTGYINDEVRNALYHWADVAVFPSLYEPFGIVALEAMAAKTPVVVTDNGGLSEIVIHGVDGLKAYCGNSRSLADNILPILQQRKLAATLRDNAYRKVVKDFNWSKIAKNTIQVYKEVLKEHRMSNWSGQDNMQGVIDRFSRLFGNARTS